MGKERKRGQENEREVKRLERKNERERKERGKTERRERKKGRVIMEEGIKKGK